MLEEAGGRLHVVQALDLVAARRVQQARQQLLANVHLREKAISVMIFSSLCRCRHCVSSGQSGHENRKVAKSVELS